MTRRRQSWGEWAKQRPTADLLILIIAGTICFSVLMYGLVVSVLVFAQPDKDHSEAVTLLSNTFQMLIGLLAGFVAGRTEKTLRSGKDEPEPEPGQHPRR